jgi:long-chain acyl-CoA synthetase
VTIGDLLTERARARPHATFTIDADSGGERSYAEVYERALRWAALFEARAVHRVATVLPNSVDVIDLYFGAALAGVTLAPLHPALADEEVAAHVRRSRSDLLVASPGRAGALADLWRHQPERTLAMSRVDLPLPGAPRPAAEVHVLVQTSGTSGSAKACRLTHANLLWTSARTVEAFGLDATSRYLTPLSLHHVNAQVIGVLAALQAGAAVAVAPRLPAARLWNAAARVRATGLSLVPALVHDLLIEPGGPPPSLRFAVCSSAPLPIDSHARFQAQFGLPLCMCYGMSEAACFATYTRPSVPGPAGASGVPHGCEVAIEDGEILLRGSGVFAGYDDDAAATRAVLSGDGWLRTGDEGVLDPDGFLYVRGRRKEMINRGGEKIPPAEVEAVLLACPGVAAACVFAMADERLGEEVAAAIVRANGASLGEDDLWSFCAGRLAEFETPRRFYFVDALPIGPTGKVLRRELSRRFGA